MTLKKKLRISLAFILGGICGAILTNYLISRQLTTRCLSDSQLQLPTETETTAALAPAQLVVYNQNQTPIFELTLAPAGGKLLSALERDPDLKVEYTMSDYGAFITSLAGISQSEDLFWLYYVNGEYAQVGVSEYDLQPGDLIEFKLEKYLID